MRKHPPQFSLKQAFPAIVAVSILLSAGVGATARVRTGGQDDPGAPRNDEPAVTQENAVRSTWDGVYTEEQAKRGKATYTQECAQCHLDDLLGDGMAPALVGSAFSFRWSDLSLGDIFASLQATMPQGAPASLSPRAYADVVAFLLSVNDYPVGDEELTPDVTMLEQILIEDKQP